MYKEGLREPRTPRPLFTKRSRFFRWRQKRRAKTEGEECPRSTERRWAEVTTHYTEGWHEERRKRNPHQEWHLSTETKGGERRAKRQERDGKTDKRGRGKTRRVCEAENTGKSRMSRPKSSQEGDCGNVAEASQNRSPQNRSYIATRIRPSVLAGVNHAAPRRRTPAEISRLSLGVSPVERTRLLAPQLSLLFTTALASLAATNTDTRSMEERARSSGFLSFVLSSVSVG